MQVHRVVLANDSRLLREMLKRVVNQVPGLHVVGEVAHSASLPSLVERTDPHWAIVCLSPGGRMPEVTNSILSQHSSVCFLGITTDGSRMKAKYAPSYEEDLGCLSLNELFALLETAPRAGSDWVGSIDGRP